MRIISGEKRGIQLQAVPGTGTRPTTDKVKEAIFNMIGPYFEGGTGLDLFAGSGNLGLEALSRGLDRMIFVDKDRKAFQTIKDNIQKCSYEKQTELFRNEAERALKAVAKREIKFECIFLDPPYKNKQLDMYLAYINEHHLLSDTGVVMCEHDASTIVPEASGNLIRAKHEIYGTTGISIYYLQKREEENNEA
ncbi:16S rRNA (guanine(966)-N(2))-methyltransferase RsmD [Jeotgalibacillus salarius]|uniref:16S rRNA (Guanine(966)-N(2))-methyltransferase RsmD n=1 Tax=Jeotgalibacillus salarius TaxID=546023 RepID=A0A4Y8LCI6_9BACL|nr:16S rRNA (guanine(966)-N(2))-methyltransferase RsmD [Jeotgalibacillus salarius]TFE00386.1 16S rRNA (guanine(966)-N(2))-methyltransferase RsmD [Jeotgalibacillus salarius]